MRVRADFYVSALVRWADGQLISATVRHVGDPERGLLLITQTNADHQVHIWVQQTSAEGQPCWHPRFEALLSETEADAFIARERARDGDLWVIDVLGKDIGLPPVLPSCKGGV